MVNPKIYTCESALVALFTTMEIKSITEFTLSMHALYQKFKPSSMDYFGLKFNEQNKSRFCLVHGILVQNIPWKQIGISDTAHDNQD